MKLMFTGDINFRGVESLDYEVAEVRIWQKKISELQKMLI